MNHIEMPKSDKRYRIGNIAKDKNGRYRGNPATVELKRMPLPPEAPLHMQLNPPLVASIELARHLKRRKQL